MKLILALFSFEISNTLPSSLCLAIVLLTISLSFGADEIARVTLSVARDRAVLMHQIYTTTLDVMHDRYFHADRSVVPARAMEDVFENLERETGSKAN